MPLFAPSNRNRIGLGQALGVDASGCLALNDPGDDCRIEEREALAETLIEDWQRFEGWRLVERYCPTDPCDPASERPDEITAAAARYGAMVPSDLMVNRWVGEHEHFLRDAGPGVARFTPQSGVSLTRAFLEDILTRPSAVATLALNVRPCGGICST